MVRPSPRRAGTLALIVLALGYASFAQGVGWNQYAHYALVQALAEGTAVVDAYTEETGDTAFFQGHYYSTKAPGLAFATLPAYLALDALGVTSLFERVPGAADSSVGTLWALGLVGVVLPALCLLLLVRRLADSLEPGLGVAAALTLGLGTLVLPFATVFFSHVLATALAFAAFAIVWLERERRRELRPAVVAAAGLLGGLAVTTEYPLALAGAIVGLYALARGRILRTGASYALGVAAGVAPLLLYNWWAFGTATHISYRNAVLTGGASGHDVLGANDAGFFGVSGPSFSAAVELLFSRIGLLTLTPVVALGAVGAVLLYRRGRRAEAVTIGGVAAAYLVFNSGYFQLFGGFTPGPRFLIPMLPFLAVPLALAYRRLPLMTTALAAVSALAMAAVTVTGPLLAHDGRWHDRLLNGWFAGRAWPAIVPFVLAAAVSVALAARATPSLPVRRGDAWTAALALAGWALVAGAGWRTLDIPDRGALGTSLPVAVLALAVVATVAFSRRLLARSEPAAATETPHSVQPV